MICQPGELERNRLAKGHPARFPDHRHLALQPIILPFPQQTGRTLTLLLAGVVLLLIIGCANCSILLLACGRMGQHELAIRGAIGASRWRIVRQLLSKTQQRQAARRRRG